MSIHRRITSIGIIALLSVSVLFNCTKEVGSDELLERNGLKYEVNSDKPYTGLAFDTYKNGQRDFVIAFIDGEQNGTAKSWYENGQQKYIIEFIDGERNGTSKVWYENGQQKSEESYKDGNLVSSPTRWFPDGTYADMTDIDGNIYETVQIGNQVWMAENLRVTHYRDGTAITNITDEAAWSDSSTEAYCYYDNNSSNGDTYGALYNWYAVSDSRKIAPAGWHVPTDTEWKELEMYLGMSQSEADDTGYRGTNEGSKLAGNADLWDSGALENDSAFGSSGFTALPGGGRYYDGSYSHMGYFGSFWSATEYGSNFAWYRNLPYFDSDVLRNYLNKRFGFAVRLLRD